MLLIFAHQFNIFWKHNAIQNWEEGSTVRFGATGVLREWLQNSRYIFLIQRWFRVFQGKLFSFGFVFRKDYIAQLHLDLAIPYYSWLCYWIAQYFACAYRNWFVWQIGKNIFGQQDAPIGYAPSLECSISFGDFWSMRHEHDNVIRKMDFGCHTHAI